MPYMDINNLKGRPILSKVEKIWHLAEGQEPSSVIYPCGYELFDKAMDGGFRPGELVVVSAQTGQGKTTWCQNLAKNFDKKGWASLWFSYEMNLWYLREKFKKLGCDENLNAYAPVEALQDSVMWMCDIIHEAIEDYDCRMVFIDHLHYLIPLNSDVVNSLTIGALVRAIKLIAVQKNIVVFLIAHSKKVYQTEKFDLSSIRDSSLIAQEADYVFLIERLKKDASKLAGEDSEWTNQAKITLAKNRRTGESKFLICEHKNGQFLEIVDYWTPPPSSFSPPSFH